MNIIIPYVIYPFNVMFSFGETDKLLYSALKPFGIKRTDKSHKYEDEDNAITIHYSDGFTLIRTRVVPKTPEDFGHLQHEIFHAVIYLMEYVGASLSAGSNENFAYIIGYLTTEIYKKIMA